jgi:hypothetical protein
MSELPRSALGAHPSARPRLSHIAGSASVRRDTRAHHRRQASAARRTRRPVQTGARSAATEEQTALTGTAKPTPWRGATSLAS